VFYDKDRNDSDTDKAADRHEKHKWAKSGGVDDARARERRGEDRDADVYRYKPVKHLIHDDDVDCDARC
jgi:hypothetical protein